MEAIINGVRSSNPINSFDEFLRPYQNPNSSTSIPFSSTSDINAERSSAAANSSNLERFNRPIIFFC
ncbi:hypothetical protein HanPSC8_Chr05g0205131 [Helianthus annuus]|nr:hypothetical protein HanPSC8_Chr05g0205131 [Helianthus annuus]